MSQSAISPPKRFSKQAASARLGVPIRSIDRLIESGELRAVKIPGLNAYVTEQSIEDLIRKMHGEDRQAG
jgi:hypothetical protein